MSRFPESAVFYRRLDREYTTLVRGEGVFLFDSSGKRYLDGSGGAVVVNVGHGRPEVAEAIGQQARTVAYAHGTQFTTEALEQACAELANHLPPGLSKVYLVSGGSEATETAIKLARQYQLACGRPTRYQVVGRWPSYHGSTIAALSASGRASLRRPYQPLLLDFPHVPAPYCYRCPLGQTYPECGVQCAQALETLLKLEGPDSVAAFIAEPIIGASAGAAAPPPEYFPILRDICDRYHVLLIADEVMTGFGRTGRFFAVQHFGVVPDIMILGKGLTGGYAPAGAVAVRGEIAQALRDRFGNFTHGFTFSHNPIVAAACREVLAILGREELVARAAARGNSLLQKLRTLERFPLVGDIRGLGLLAGIEFVADRETKKPYPRSRRLVEEIVDRAFERGLILYPSTGCADGVDGDLVIVAPPFIIEESEIDLLVELLAATLSEVKP
jgi:adenosylmethionine-8-amino-7-oxononanoate aminotransferase